KVVGDYDKIGETPGEFVMKILAFDSDLERIDRVSEMLAQSGSLAGCHSSRRTMEITHTDPQKGIALNTIAERLNIDMENVMAIGDNTNDISMLERVGDAVAMDNAAPEVKAIAKYQTDANEHSGVGKAIMTSLKENNKI